MSNNIPTRPAAPAAAIAAYIAKVVAEAPPLSADQRAKLGSLLRGDGA